MKSLVLTDAQCALVEEHYHLVRYACRDHGWMLRGDESYGHEDIEQIAALGLMAAARNYKPGAWSFPSFARYCMKLAIQKEECKMKRHRRIANVKAIRLDAPVPCESDTPMTWLDTLAADEDAMGCVSIDQLMIRDLNAVLQRYLGEQGFQLLQMRMSGYSNRMIAKLLGLSIACVNLHMADVGKRLESIKPQLQARLGYAKGPCANTSLGQECQTKQFLCAL